MERRNLYWCLLLVACTTSAFGGLEKRVLPHNQQCDPRSGTCVKGDWVSKSIADCSFQRSFSHPISCTPVNNVPIHWVVQPEANGNCLPNSNKLIQCGSSGTNTRCVCSSPKAEPNQCRCQYWPNETPGQNENAFCTAYYINVGPSRVHQYACCDNCRDSDSSCKSETWHGGSSISYCNECGIPNGSGGGVPKYYFNCDDCNTQTGCASTCSGYNFPGLCWKWVDCFTGCCRKMAQQYARRRAVGSTLQFCGDGTCDQQSEDPDICPSDCCYLRNSTCASEGCTPECCGAPGCCGTSSSRSASFCGVFGLSLALVWVLLFTY